MDLPGPVEVWRLVGVWRLDLPTREIEERYISPERIAALHARSMQIKLTFCDDEGLRFGWAPDYSGLRNVERRDSVCGEPEYRLASIHRS